MNPRRSNSNRPFRSNSSGGGYGGRSGGGGGGGGGGGYGGRRGGGGGPRGRGKKPPMLLGEPSPSLAKIQTMNTEKLRAKIASLNEERARLVTRHDNLAALDPVPTEKVDNINDLIARIDALLEAAKERLAGKLERAAARRNGTM
ncbi:MAG: hypothetical protein AAGI68_05800 [Planctomycetota bacterium]